MQFIKDLISKVPAPDQDTRAGRAVMSTGHHRDRIDHLQNALMLAGPFIGNRRVRTVVRAANLGVAMATLTASIAHDRALCEACIADMPLDGPEQAEIHAFDLKAFHHCSEHRSTQALLLALPWATTPLRRFGRRGVVADIAFGIAVTSWYRHVSATHHRLEPWCPQCRKDDGGERVPEPVGGPAVSL